MPPVWRWRSHARGLCLRLHLRSPPRHHFAGSRLQWRSWSIFSRSSCHSRTRRWPLHLHTTRSRARHFWNSTTTLSSITSPRLIFRFWLRAYPSGDEFDVRPDRSRDSGQRNARHFSRLQRHSIQAARFFTLSAALAGLAGANKAIAFKLATLVDVHWMTSGNVVLMTVARRTWDPVRTSRGGSRVCGVGELHLADSGFRPIQLCDWRGFHSPAFCCFVAGYRWKPPTLCPSGNSLERLRSMSRQR